MQDIQTDIDGDRMPGTMPIVVMGEEGGSAILERAIETGSPVMVLEPEWMLTEGPGIPMTLGTALLTGAAIAALGAYYRALKGRRRIRRITIIE